MCVCLCAIKDQEIYFFVQMYVFKQVKPDIIKVEIKNTGWNLTY